MGAQATKNAAEGGRRFRSVGARVHQRLPPRVGFAERGVLRGAMARRTGLALLWLAGASRTSLAWQGPAPMDPKIDHGVSRSRSRRERVTRQAWVPWQKDDDSGSVSGSLSPTTAVRATRSPYAHPTTPPPHHAAATTPPSRLACFAWGLTSTTAPSRMAVRRMDAVAAEDGHDRHPAR